MQLYKISTTTDATIVLLLFFYVLWGIYPFIILKILWAWRKSEPQPLQQDHFPTPMVSVVVVFRNEAKHLPSLIHNLFLQKWPAGNFEIIMVNDHSSDKSVEILQRFQSQFPSCNLQVLSLPGRFYTSPKKAGIQMAVEAARGSIIICTDGDCRVSPDWIRNMANPLLNEKADFVAGPVMYYGSGFWNNVLQIEFSSLVASSAASILYNIPLMSNGANMAFTREAFLAAGGFDGTMDLASGDDVTLMMNIHKIDKKGVIFLKDSGARVFTAPPLSFSDFMQQRFRWAGKWNRGTQKSTMWIPVMVFIYHLSLITGISLFFFIKKVGIFIILALALKGLTEFVLLGTVMSFFTTRMRLDAFLFTFSIYPFYTVFFGLAAQVKGFYWKDRRYKKV
ncbi:MAG: glycosyltransferase [Cyclobacteriaceae bacterium]|nr:glycosyltransferase [Cyclobacteriaceae bacterium]